MRRSSKPTTSLASSTRCVASCSTPRCKGRGALNKGRGALNGAFGVTLLVRVSLVGEAKAALADVKPGDLFFCI